MRAGKAWAALLLTAALAMGGSAAAQAASFTAGADTLVACWDADPGTIDANVRYADGFSENFHPGTYTLVDGCYSFPLAAGHGPVAWAQVHGFNCHIGEDNTGREQNCYGYTAPPTQEPEPSTPPTSEPPVESTPPTTEPPATLPPNTGTPPTGTPPTEPSTPPWTEPPATLPPTSSPTNVAPSPSAPGTTPSQPIPSAAATGAWSPTAGGGAAGAARSLTLADTGITESRATLGVSLIAICLGILALLILKVVGRKRPPK